MVACHLLPQITCSRLQLETSGVKSGINKTVLRTEPLKGLQTEIGHAGQREGRLYQLAHKILLGERKEQDSHSSLFLWCQDVTVKLSSKILIALLPLAHIQDASVLQLLTYTADLYVPLG